MILSRVTHVFVRHSSNSHWSEVGSDDHERRRWVSWEHWPLDWHHRHLVDCPYPCLLNLFKFCFWTWQKYWVGLNVTKFCLLTYISSVVTGHLLCKGVLAGRWACRKSAVSFLISINLHRTVVNIGQWLPTFFDPFPPFEWLRLPSPPTPQPKWKLHFFR